MRVLNAVRKVLLQRRLSTAEHMRSIMMELRGISSALKRACVTAESKVLTDGIGKSRNTIRIEDAGLFVPFDGQELRRQAEFTALSRVQITILYADASISQFIFLVNLLRQTGLFYLTTKRLSQSQK